MEKNNNVKIMAVFATVLLVFIVITASFAYFGSFNVNLNNNVAVNINAVSPGNATFVSTATQLNLQVPAANMSQTASNNEIAAASNTATLTVNLTGAANLLTTCTYDIVYEYDAGSNVYGKSPTTKNGDKEITLQVSNVNGTNNFVNEKNFDFDSSWTNNKRTLVSGATISSVGTLTTQNISITGKYYNLTIPQTSIEGKAFTGKIYVTNHSCSTSEIPGYYTILANNGGEVAIKAKGSPNFSTTATTNEGMYAAQDDLGDSYYFRGAVDNNWVKFGKGAYCMYNNNVVEYVENDGTNVFTRWVSSAEECVSTYVCTNTFEEFSVVGLDSTTCSNFGGTLSNTKATYDNLDIYWRIIRINGDGSIRMIYTGTTAPKESTKVVMTGTGTQISDKVFNINSNSSTDKAEYVGYMYTSGQQHGNSESSEIKTTIDNWYKTTTLETDSATKSLVADQIFCNDRTASTSAVTYSTTNYTTLTSWNSKGIYYYGAYGRLYPNKKPILTCPTASDKFTVNESNGNGALTYPVGLITADEIAMAGGLWNTNNSSYYLYTNRYYWSGSPSSFDSHGYANEFIVRSSGNLNIYSLDSGAGFRAVVSLSSKAKLSGSGTYNDVYTVS